MLSFLSLVLYVTVIPVGLVLGSAPERLALLAVAAHLVLRLVARRRSATGSAGRATPAARALATR